MHSSQGLYFSSTERWNVDRACIVCRNLCSLVCPFHDSLDFDFLKAHDILTLDLEFVLKWVKTVIGCMLYIFHLSAHYRHSVAILVSEILNLESPKDFGMT